jgi:hypothetical protein
VPNPRAYLEDSLVRWVDRGTLIRRDAQLMLEGLEGKGRLLEELRERIKEHRRDDISQLTNARRETQLQWDERLKRLEGWIASGAEVGQNSGRLHAWKNSALWFDHARKIGERYGLALEPKAARLEKQLLELAEKVRLWSDRLLLKEADVRGFVERETVKGMEVLISSARKRPYLDFVYAEREEEARLAGEFKRLRGAANHALERFTRADKWASQKVLANPAYFEIRKNQILDLWSPIQRRIQQIREGTLNQALAFEEGRRRLRWFYDAVQRMRVVHETAPRRKPLLERLFKPQED